MKQIKAAFSIKKIIIINVFLAFAISTIFAAGSDAKWETIKYSSGIKVERREVPGSSIVQFRGSGLVNASVLEILAVISDTDNHPKWVENCIETKILEERSEKEYVYYSSTKAPWPVSDREFVSLARVIVNDKPGHRSIRIATHETNHAKAPKNTGRVRMPFIRVTWNMSSLAKYKGAKTWLTFTVHADPGGLLPAWVVNMVSKKVPFNSIKNLKSRIKNGGVSKEFRQKYKKYENWY